MQRQGFVLQESGNSWIDMLRKASRVSSRLGMVESDSDSSGTSGSSKSGGDNSSGVDLVSDSSDESAPAPQPRRRAAKHGRASRAAPPRSSHSSSSSSSSGSSEGSGDDSDGGGNGHDGVDVAANVRVLDSGRWQVNVNDMHGKQYDLGTFEDRREAVSVYRAAARALEAHFNGERSWNWARVKPTIRSITIQRRECLLGPGNRRVLLCCPRPCRPRACVRVCVCVCVLQWASSASR